MQPLASTPSRTEQVYSAIRDNICDLTLEPGTHLVQEELAATLGVSRQPVQQAMQLLRNDGLVVESGGRGLVVAPIDPEAMEHHYQIRLALDQLAAGLVADRARDDAAFSARLRRDGYAILTRGEKALQGGSAVKAVKYDVAFHSFIYDMSGNPFIGPTAEAHWFFLRRIMVGVLLHAERGSLVWSEHTEILSALVDGDAIRSVDLATRHVVGAKQSLVDAMSSGRADHLFRPITSNGAADQKGRRSQARR